ncbi:hypothetical protein ACNTMW_02510 [Planosporangium sp. 12N6]
MRTPAPGGTRPTGRRVFALPRRVRRLMVIAHIAVSVGWWGLSLCLLALATTARLSDQPATIQAGYRAMAILAHTLVLPVSVASLLTGLLLSIGRPWGLTRHYWILAKLILTVAAAIASNIALPALIGGAVAHLSTGPSGVDTRTANGLVIAPAVAVATYTAIVAISVLKPWGRIGHRPR